MVPVRRGRGLRNILTIGNSLDAARDASIRAVGYESKEAEKFDDNVLHASWAYGDRWA